MFGKSNKIKKKDFTNTLYVTLCKGKERNFIISEDTMTTANSKITKKDFFDMVYVVFNKDKNGRIYVQYANCDIKEMMEMGEVKEGSVVGIYNLSVIREIGVEVRLKESK